MQRYDIINTLLRRFQLETYLEIGVSNPALCFDKIKTANKTSIDPGIEYRANPVDFKLTSDKFFSQLEQGNIKFSPDYKWDVIFIDGLHLAEQCYRDIKNSLNHLSDNGFIVLHDCNPPDSFHAREDYKIEGKYVSWNGTVWKAFYKIRTEGLNLETYVVDTDWGIGVIKKTDSPRIIPQQNPFYEYNVMADNRKEHLGLVTVEEFLDNII